MIKNISQSKIIVFTTLTAMLVSFVFLSITEKRQMDINTKNVWMAYFANPKDSSLNFTIENHSNGTNFHWEILLDKESVKSGDAAINNGQSKTISVSPASIQNKKVTITVTDSENKTKEIYKIIP